MRAEAVGAGEIEDAGVQGCGSAQQTAFLAFNGDARIVADLGAQASQGVEESGLAAVRVAGEDDVGSGGGLSGARSVMRDA